MGKVFIGTKNLEEVATKVGSQVILGPAYTNPRLFERLGVKVLTGVKFKAVDYLLVGKGGTARRKDVHPTLNTSAGYLKERKMIAKLVWDHFTMNVDDFVETPFSQGANGPVSFPLSEAALEKKLNGFALQLDANTFWGDTSKDENGDASDADAAMALFDGFNVLVAHEIEAGAISEKMGNLVKCKAITRPADNNDTAAFDNAYEWYLKLSPALRKNPAGFKIWVSTLVGSYIAQAYANRSHGTIKVNYNEDGDFSVPEMPRVTFVVTDEYGVGDRLTATIADNFVYGVDTENDKTFVSTKVGTDADHRAVTFQIQAIQGTRLDNPLKEAFAISDGSLVSDAYLGEYIKEDLTIGFNATAGSVEVDGAAYSEPIELEFNKVYTLEAKAQTGYKFDHWSNGAKDAKISIVSKGEPIELVATFKKEA